MDVHLVEETSDSIVIVVVGCLGFGEGVREWLGGGLC